MPEKTRKTLRSAAAARALEYAASISDEEDAKLTAAALSDPDNPPMTDERFARLRRVGRPKAQVTKQSVTVRLDRDVIAKLKQGGDGWQTRINIILRGQLKLSDPSKAVVTGKRAAQKKLTIEQEKRFAKMRARKRQRVLRPASPRKRAAV